MLKSEYGVSSNALTSWIRQYSEVKLDDNTVVTTQQIKDLQKRNAQLEEENLKQRFLWRTNRILPCFTIVFPLFPGAFCCDKRGIS